MAGIATIQNRCIHGNRLLQYQRFAQWILELDKLDE